ncbi:TPA: DUF3820 family protein [Pseudomonas aeruginosa]
MLDKQHLLKIARTPMPFGKYQGRLMQLTLELKIDGLDGLLKPLRPPAP